MLRFAYIDAAAYRERDLPRDDHDYTLLAFSDLVTCHPGFVWLYRGDVLLPLEAAGGSRWRALQANVVLECEETGDALFVKSVKSEIVVPPSVDAADPRLWPFRLEPLVYPRLMPRDVAASLGISPTIGAALALGQLDIFEYLILDAAWAPTSQEMLLQRVAVGEGTFAVHEGSLVVVDLDPRFGAALDRLLSRGWLLPSVESAALDVSPAARAVHGEVTAAIFGRALDAPG